jgi:ribosome biogenesis GTPase
VHTDANRSLQPTTRAACRGIFAPNFTLKNSSERGVVLCLFRNYSSTQNNIWKEITLNLTDYGFIPTMLPENAEGIPARVTAVHRERYELACEYGECFGQLKSSVYYGGGNEDFPTTGDFVLIDYNPGGDSRILRTLPRKSKFARNDFSGHAAAYVKTVLEQLVAANFDYVFIMQSLNFDFNPKRLERYVTLAWQSGATPVVILTKADLCDNREEQLRAAEKTASGVGVFAVSAKTGY